MGVVERESVRNAVLDLLDPCTCLVMSAMMTSEADLSDASTIASREMTAELATDELPRGTSDTQMVTLTEVARSLPGRQVARRASIGKLLTTSNSTGSPAPRRS